MKKFIVILLTFLMALSFAACTEKGDTETAAPPKSNAGEQTNASDSNAGDGKILVTYFSATNTTEGVAKTIADVLGADLYEIMPEDPYTDADLNYNDDNSRSTIEMNDSSVRPAISGSVENWQQYDTVLIGYPIWLAYPKLIQCTQTFCLGAVAFSPLAV